MGFSDRPLGELLILLASATICFAVVATGTGILIVILLQPERDITIAVEALAFIINTMLGILAGYFIGINRGVRIAKRNGG